ncbi:MAG: hypothetical protein ABMA15_06995, partial [Vicinamibacterales bacterium]
AYQSDESGRPEIYVRPFVPPSLQASVDRSAVSREASADKSAVALQASADKPGATGTTAGGAGGQWQVSTAGGITPTWRADGKELFYVNPAGAMMAAPITVTGATLAPGAPAVLFPTRIYGGGVDNQQNRQYDVAPDGRFLINTVIDSATAPITLLMNWNPDSKR